MVPTCVVHDGGYAGQCTCALKPIAKAAEPSQPLALRLGWSIERGDYSWKLQDGRHGYLVRPTEPDHKGQWVFGGNWFDAPSLDAAMQYAERYAGVRP